MKGGNARRSVLTLAHAVAIALVVAGAVAARPAPGPVVDVQSAAGLAPDGRSLTVQVLASCPDRSTVVESVVRVSQDEASGEASFSLTCTGSLRSFTVVVPAAAGTFELGRAQATASVVSRQGKTRSAQDSELLFVQPTVVVDLADSARLESGGGAVTIAVTVACPAGASGAQSYVNVSQDQAIGSGTYVPACDGSPHTFDVRVVAAQGAYQAAAARALTFANVEQDGNGFSGVDDAPIQIVP